MSKIVLLAEFISVNGNTLNQFTRQASLSIDVEDKDITTFGDGGWNARLGGLKSGELSLDFLNDFAAGALDSIIWPLLGTVVPFIIRVDQAAVSATNPNYTGSVLVTEWSPIGGSIGDENSVSVTWPVSGAITRATS